MTPPPLALRPSSARQARGSVDSRGDVPQNAGRGMTTQRSDSRSPQGERERAYGVAICAGVLLAFLALLEGMRRRSYWAIALPVLLASGAVLSLAFWVGWVLFTHREAPVFTRSLTAPARRRARSPAPPSAN